MHRKKILIITHGFHPEQSPRSFRASELAKEFCRQGHQLTVIAPYREGTNTLANEYGFKYISLGASNWKIFNFERIGAIGRLYNKAVNRLLPLLFEYPMMEIFFKVRKVLKQEKDSYDLLVSVAVPYPIHWGVASVWKSGGNNVAKKWIADCGDPYCLQENDTFQPLFYFKWVEKWFMRRADFVSVPTENSFKGYFPEFHSKLRVIPQGFRFEDIERRPLIEDGIIRFGYGGVFIHGRRDPKEFIEFLVQLPKELRFEFHIYTLSSHLVEPHTKGDDRIILHHPIERKQLLGILSSFRFVVNFGNKGQAQTPSKLIDYAILDKPILQVETGALDKDNVLLFLKGNYQGRLKLGKIDSYRIEHVANQFISLLF